MAILVKILIDFICAEGRELAASLGCRFIETSAKLSINVNEAFAEIVREIRKSNKVEGLLSSSLKFI
jgi:GTPase SAR1 family protein